MGRDSNWIKSIKKIRKEIKSLEPKDRLGYVTAVACCVAAIANSMHGWKKWLIHPEVMNSFSEEELDKLFEVFKKLALETLKEDINWTKKKEEEAAQIADEQQLTYIG